MIELYNINEPYEYVLECDKKPAEVIKKPDSEDTETEEIEEHIPTVWELKRLTMSEERFLSRKGKEAAQKKRTDVYAEYTESILHIGLLGVKKTKGTEPVFERNESANVVFGEIKPWTDETLAQIDRTYRDELASEIIGYSKLKVAEIKNS